MDKPRQPRGGWKGAAGASPDVCWGGVEWARVGWGGVVVVGCVGWGWGVAWWSGR